MTCLQDIKITSKNSCRPLAWITSLFMGDAGVENFRFTNIFSSLFLIPISHYLRFKISFHSLGMLRKKVRELLRHELHKNFFVPNHPTSDLRNPLMICKRDKKLSSFSFPPSAFLFLEMYKQTEEGELCFPIWIPSMRFVLYSGVVFMHEHEGHTQERCHKFSIWKSAKKNFQMGIVSATNDNFLY